MNQDRASRASRTCQISIPPKLIKQWIIEPVVMALAVQVKQPHACSDAQAKNDVFIPQHNVEYD
jgi:hypothetical protein